MIETLLIAAGMMVLILAVGVLLGGAERQRLPWAPGSVQFFAVPIAVYKEPRGAAFSLVLAYVSRIE
jgi:hypothetical protein